MNTLLNIAILPIVLLMRIGVHIAMLLPAKDRMLKRTIE